MFDGLTAAQRQPSSVRGLLAFPYPQRGRIMAERSEHLVSEKEARDVAEAARESEWSGPSFVRDLFLGRFRLDLIHPFPADDPAEAARGKPFLDKLAEFLRRVDSDMI